MTFHPLIYVGNLLTTELFATYFMSLLYCTVQNVAFWVVKRPVVPPCGRDEESQPVLVSHRDSLESTNL